MRLLHLRLENYRRFPLAEMEFPDGITALVGRNGAGKSTVVEALGWVLFGHDAARTGKEHLRMRGARGDCRVYLAFELDGQEYEIIRELSGKGQQHLATIKAGGRILVHPGANSAKEANQAVERILRMDRDAFFTSLVARQGELSSLSDLTPARRKEVVMRMLRIDAIDTAINLAREEKRRLQAHLEGLAGQAGDPAALAQRVTELEQARIAETAALETALLTLAGIEESLLAVSKARSVAENLAREDGELATKSALERARGEVARRAAEEARKLLADLAALAVEEQRLAPDVERFAKARPAVEALETQRERHRERQRLRGELLALEPALEDASRRHEAAAAEAAQVSLARDDLDRARADRAAAEQILGESLAHAKTLDETFAEARRSLGQAAARRSDLERLGAEAICPTCEQQLSDALPRLLARLDEETGGLRNRVEALQKRRAHQEQQVAAKRAAAAAAQAREDAAKKRAEHVLRREAEAILLQRTREDLAGRLLRLRSALSTLGPETFDEPAYVAQKRDLAALELSHQRWLQLRARLEARPRIQEQLERQEGEVARAQAEIGRLEARRAGLGHDPASRQALEERFTSLQARVRAQAVEAERRRGGLLRIDAEETRLGQERDRLRDLELKMAEIRAEVVLLDRLAGERDSGLLADFRSHLMGRVRPALAQRASDLFRACTEGRYDGLELSEDYDLQVLEQGLALPLARFSGGEADLANLCLRIAVGEVLAERAGEPLGFLALDEVFGSQDQQRRALILGALARLRGRFRQILVVTHVEEVKEAADHVVYVEDDARGQGRLVPGEGALLALAAA